MTFRSLFGARGQVIVGILFTLVGLYLWVYYTFWSEPNVRTVFHISMLFGVVACYSIVSNGLTYKATERVEEVVTSGDVDVEHADSVNLSRPD